MVAEEPGTAHDGDGGCPMKRYVTRTLAVVMGFAMIFGAMAAYIIGVTAVIGPIAFVVAGAAKVAWGLL